MTKSDKEYIDTLLDNIFIKNNLVVSKMVNALELKLRDMSAGQDITHLKMEEIIRHQKETNGRVLKTEGQVEELEDQNLTHIINCPQADKVRALEDTALSHKYVRRWIAGSVGVAGGLIGAIWMLWSIFGN